MNFKICLVLSLFICSSFAAFLPFPYQQNDAKWRNTLIGFGNKTIGQDGSLLVSLASLAAGEGIIYKGWLFTPNSMNDWLKLNKGFVNNDQIVLDSLSPLGLEYVDTLTNINEIVHHLIDGKIMIIKLKEGYYAPVFSVVSGGFVVVDPTKEGTGYYIYAYNYVENVVIYNWNPKYPEIEDI